DPQTSVARRPQLALGQAHGDAAHVEAPGVDGDRLFAAGDADVHSRREIRALDRQNEGAAGVAARDLAGGRVGFLLPVAGDLRVADGELGGGVDAVVGAGAAHDLLDLGAAVANL